MHVMVNCHDQVLFQQLYQDYLGKPAESLQTFAMALAPGHADTMWVYAVPDQTALATWIQLQHPEWIDRTGSWYQIKGTE
jgi:nitrous oxide reductase accessory protein NosL